MKVITNCRNERTVRCVGRQDCFAQSVGMSEYCRGTFKEATGIKAVVYRLGSKLIDWIYSGK
jgi:hypothetical protein